MFPLTHFELFDLQKKCTNATSNSVLKVKLWWSLRMWSLGQFGLVSLQLPTALKRSLQMAIYVTQSQVIVRVELKSSKDTRKCTKESLKFSYEESLGSVFGCLDRLGMGSTSLCIYANMHTGFFYRNKPRDGYYWLDICFWGSPCSHCTSPGNVWSLFPAAE